MKAKDMRELSLQELQKKLHDTRDELALLNIRKQVGQVENTAQISESRREIARINTLLKEKQNAESVGA